MRDDRCVFLVPRSVGGDVVGDSSWFGARRAGFECSASRAVEARGDVDM